MLVHTGCGGTIIESGFYYPATHDLDDDTREPVLICDDCEEEIVGDYEIELEYAEDGTTLPNTPELTDPD